MGRDDGVAPLLTGRREIDGSVYWIRDSFRVIGSKRYIRLYQRANGQAPWQSITIDVSAG